MPQMAPISWLILFIVFFITFVLFNMMNYYSFNLSPPKPDQTQNFKVKSMIWKW